MHDQGIVIHTGIHARTRNPTWSMQIAFRTLRRNNLQASCLRPYDVEPVWPLFVSRDVLPAQW